MLVAMLFMAQEAAIVRPIGLIRPCDSVFTSFHSRHGENNTIKVQGRQKALESHAGDP